MTLQFEKTRGAGAPGGSCPLCGRRQRAGARGAFGAGPLQGADRASSLQGRAARDGAGPPPQGHRGHRTSAPRAQPRECRRARVRHPGRASLQARALWDPHPDLISRTALPVNDTPSWELRGDDRCNLGLCVAGVVPVGVQGSLWRWGPPEALPPCCAPCLPGLRGKLCILRLLKSLCGGRGLTDGP